MAEIQSNHCQSAIKNEKGKIYKIQTLVIQYIHVLHWLLTIITSSYRLNNGRKYSQIDVRVALTKKKEKIYKLQILVIQSTYTFY